MDIQLLFPNFKTKALTFSYDDNVVFDKRFIEIMLKYGLKGTFNVNSGLFATESGGRKLTIDEAIALYLPSGMEVAVHGVQHLTLTQCSHEEAYQEISMDRENLEKAFGGVIRGMAYANGKYNDEAVEVLKECGIAYARTTDITESFALPTDWLRLASTCHHSHPKLMEFADEFLSGEDGNDPKLFYVWGHTYEFNDNNNWEIIENFAEKVGNRKDVWYATNIEIYEYIEAYRHLIYSSDGKTVYNPSGKDVYVRVNGKSVILLAGKTRVFA